MIQPVKVEIVHLDPKIYVLREILSEVETERLKELAAPKVRINAKSPLGVLGMAWGGEASF